MYNRIYKFLDKNKIIYSLQFGFRQHYSTSYALLNLTEAIIKAQDVFVDLQKAFDTVNHSILLRKLWYYGILGVKSKWFESYFAKRKQFVSINGFASSTSSITCGVPQGSVLVSLRFLLRINDLHVAIKHCKAHHFADNANLLIINKSLKRLHKLLKIDLNNLINWPNANKISLNVSKTEIIIFKPKRKLRFQHENKVKWKNIISN